MAAISSAALTALAAGSLLTGAASVYTAVNKPKPPQPPELPSPIEEVDVSASRELMKRKAKERRGRASTILGSQTLGVSGQGKTVVG